MRKALSLLGAGLLALTLGAVVGQAAPSRRVVAARTKASVLKYVTNGEVRVGDVCNSEVISSLDRSLKFYDRPPQICAIWSEKAPVAWAVWELWKEKFGGPGEKIASGSIAAVGLTDTSYTWTIALDPLDPKFPLHNETATVQRYFVKVISKKTATETTGLPSVPGVLVHLPKADEPKPKPKDPYTCKPKTAEETRRFVQFGVTEATVNSTTSTSGDGDRDELYFKIDRLGPGKDHGAKRIPGGDDYYEAKPRATYTNNYTNKDQKKVARPLFWTGSLVHGQIVTLGVTAMEQDNSDLMDIKNKLTEALLKVEEVALKTNNMYGAIVGAVAGLAAVHVSLIPDTKGHDFIGIVLVQAENKCGHIRIVWTTFEEWTIDGIGTLKNRFINWKDQKEIEARLIVLSSPKTGFTTDQKVDWGEYTYAKEADDFWWETSGSSSAKYTFTLQSRLVSKEELDNAAKNLP